MRPALVAAALAGAALVAAVLVREFATMVAPASSVPRRDPPLVDMPRRVLALTGPDAVDCGGYPLVGVPGSRQSATRDQLRAALACARTAMDANRPFWTYNERRGIDSWVADGLLRTSDGQLVHFLYDSAPCGGPACEPRLDVRSCSTPVIQPGAGGDDPDFVCETR